MNPRMLHPRTCFLQNKHSNMWNENRRELVLVLHPSHVSSRSQLYEMNSTRPPMLCRRDSALQNSSKSSLLTQSLVPSSYLRHCSPHLNQSSCSSKVSTTQHADAGTTLTLTPICINSCHVLTLMVNVRLQKNLLEKLTATSNQILTTDFSCLNWPDNTSLLRSFSYNLSFHSFLPVQMFKGIEGRY